MHDLTKKALTAVFQVSQRMALPGDTHETIKDILAVLDTGMGYRHGIVTLVDKSSGDLLVEAVHGISKERYKDVRYRKGEGITGLILETSSPLAIPVVRRDPRFLNRLAIYDPDSAFIGVPITINGKTQGVLTVSVDSSERYGLDEHLKFVSMFANLIGGVIIRIVEAEREKEIVVSEKNRLQGQIKKLYRPANMVGISKVMQEVLDTVHQAAGWNTTVLIRGESGTGKELIAKAIHYQSGRASGPFVKLNCAAIPDTLLESEFFGHEKGAFTGAVTSKPGRFELANKGTLFLDEIGDTSPAFQAKLLRVLQERQFERLGGTKTISVDVRLIAATNVDLEKAVAERRFREDLYYRLNVMQIYLPPLRERREDIPYLVEHFLERIGKETGADINIDHEAMNLLENCELRGNVRELENCIYRSAVTCRDNIIRKENLICYHSQCASRLMYSKVTDSNPDRGRPGHQDSEIKEILSIENERDRVIAALKKTGWVQAKAARLLNMTPRRIGYSISKFKIKINRI